MKNTNRLIVAGLTLSMCVGMLGGSDIADAKSKAKISLAKKEITIKVKKSSSIKLKKSKGVKIKKITYKSADKKIAKVSKKGKVTGVKKGRTVIKVTVKYKKGKKTSTKKLNQKVKVLLSEVANNATDTPKSTDSPKVTVTPDQDKVSYIHLYRKKYVLYVGGKNAIKPNVYPLEAKDKSVEFLTSDKSIVDVDENGMLYGNKAGAATITIKAKDGSGVSTKAEVKVFANKEEATAVDDFYVATTINDIKEYESLIGTDEYFDAAQQQQKELAEKWLEKIEEDAVKSSKENKDNTSEDAIASFITTGIDEKTRNEVGVKPLQKYFDAIDKCDNIESLTKTSGELLKEGVFGAFNVDVLDDDDRINKAAIFGLTSYFYSDVEPEKEKRIQATIENILGRIESEEDAKNNAGKVVDFMKKMTPGKTSYDEAFDEADPKTVKVDVEATTLKSGFKNEEELQKIFKNFSIKDFCEASGMYEKEMYVDRPDLFVSFDKLYTNSNLVAIKEYEKFALIMRYFSYLGFDMIKDVEEIFTGEEQEYYDNVSQRDMVIERLRNDLDWDEAKLFTDQFVTKEMVSDVTQMIDEMLAEYRKEISECTWMEESTKANALKKIDNMVANILVPKDYDIYLFGGDLETAEEGGVFVENYRRLYSDYTKKILVRTGKLQPRDRWSMTPLWDNAAYYYRQNVISIHPGYLLGDRIYDPEGSMAKNKAGLGTIVGHEMGHAFDPLGSEYDDQGYRKNWWSDSDREKFKKIQEKVVNYFGTFFVSDYKDLPYFNNGEKTLNENVADIASINCVLHTLKTDAEKKEFFQYYPSHWSAVNFETPSWVEDKWIEDPHSSRSVRVTALLPLFDDFHRVMNVKEGDAMYVAPEDRINIFY